MRRTKIVCTLGPATDNYEVVKKLIKAGMNVARVNMSHGTHDEHRARINMIKKARKELNTPVAVLMDTKGPEIRIKTFAGGKAVLKNGSVFTLKTEDVEGSDKQVSVTYKDLPSKLKKNNKLLINDGLIEIKVVELTDKDVICKVINGGILTNRKSINIPGVHIDMPYISDIDRSDFLFGIGEDVDYVALSFVRNPDDVKQVRTLLDENGGKYIQTIAKIENRSGVDNLSKILDFSDGAMVARGDMGVEIPFEELPRIQKQMIKLCYKRGKKVITATQMLESMITSPRPTRAEISDVANAVYDGTSAIMLSGETAVGQFPVETVKAMSKIAETAEQGIHLIKRFKEGDIEIKTITDAVSHSTVAAAYDLNAKAIIAVTKSGYTARKVSRFRPSCPIIGATTSEKACNQLALNWGVVPVMAEEKPNTDELFVHAMECAEKTKYVKKGDLVIITAGVPVGISGNSNTMRIEHV